MCGVTEEIHNKFRGQVAGGVFQAGAVYGDVVMTPGSSDRVGLGRHQAELQRTLAGEVRAASRNELEKWGIRGGDALSVRWRSAAEDLLDHWENVHDSADPVPLVGHFTAIRETYKALKSKRLVILGQAGAGKTVLAHRLILDLLDNREPAPVPVLFSLSDWNPTTELSSWLVRQLVRDFPFLGDPDPATRKNQAKLFVERGIILPVLDGFDEIPEVHHRAAIGKISSLDVPLVITSRPHEYAEAARGIKAVGGAAAIALDDLDLDEACRYLRHTTSKPRACDWDEVFEYLHRAPDETESRNLTTTLTTPLMVMLARTIYNDTEGHHPSELLNDQRFPTELALQDHLLDAYLDSLYRPSGAGHHRPHGPTWNRDRARHWLGYLATHLVQRNTHDLIWWHLPTTLHRRTRVFVTTATAGVMAALAAAIPFGFWGGATHGIAAGFTFGLAFGLAFGLMGALVSELRFYRRVGRQPERLRLGPRRWGRAQSSRSSSLKRSASEFIDDLVLWGGLGIMSGLVFARAAESASGLVTVHPMMLALGPVVGTAAGLANVAVSALGYVHDPDAATPWTLFTRDRTVALVRTTTTTVLVVGFVAWFSTVLDFGVDIRIADTLSTGLMFGLVVGVLRLTWSAWGSWLLFTCLWLPMTQRLPWRPKRFLEDAYERGVLRKKGAVYQFRHSRLRSYLADHYRS